MRNPRITDASELCKKLGARRVLIIAFDSIGFGAASYGETKEECKEAGRTLDKIVDGIILGGIESARVSAI